MIELSMPSDRNLTARWSRPALPAAQRERSPDEDVRDESTAEGVALGGAQRLRGDQHHQLPCGATES